MGNILTGLLPTLVSKMGNLLPTLVSYVPNSVKDFLKGYGTFITAGISGTCALLSVLGVDMTSLSITPENAPVILVTSITALFVRRGVNNSRKETIAHIEMLLKNK